VFDQQPLTTPAFVAADAHEHPASLKTFAVQHELEITALVPLAQRFLAATIFRRVGATVP